ncbi:Type II secretion system protein G [bioreactor metagenome]|uniref:Type II secretion system core protein G n=1 Tax=bioreactor metagenome TaxID=1076179 RepID=A0A645AWF1_9ZZZZ
MYKFFTMIEMVVVIVIIATLAAVATPLYFNHVKSSRISAAKMQIGIFEQCIFNYRVDLRKLPDSLDDLIKNNSAGKRWKGPYLKGGVIPKDPWSNDYIYKKPGEHGEFDLISYGADGQPGGEDENGDVGNWTVNEE